MLPWKQQNRCDRRQTKGFSAINKCQFSDMKQQNKIYVPIETLVTMATILRVKTGM